MTATAAFEKRMDTLFLKMEEQNALLRSLKAEYKVTGDEKLKEIAALTISYRDALADEFDTAMEELAKAKF